MKPMDLVKAIMNDKKVSTSLIANRLNISVPAFCMRTKQATVTTEKLNEMLRALDYKLIAVPVDTRMPKDGFEVE